MNQFLADIVRKLAKSLCKLDLYLQRKVADEPEAQVFSYTGPREVGPDRKEVVRLAKNTRVSGAIQVVKKTTPDNLHSHQTQDGFWFVLKGKARFHGEDGPVGEFGPHEGMLTPRDFKYWYESIGDCDLEMLQVLAIDGILGRHRESFRPDNFDRSLTERSDHRRAEAISES